MDNRLFQVYGSRPHRLTRNEVPALTRALMAITRHQAHVDRHVIHNVSCVRIYNDAAGINILIRVEDWAKLVPYIKDGTFDVTQLPVEKPVVLTPNIHYDASTGEIWDHELYARIYTLLHGIFTIEFPTSTL